MNVEVLISAVFKRKPLWDQKDPEHHNRYVLDKMWDEVAAEMKTTSKLLQLLLQFKKKLTFIQMKCFLTVRFIYSILLR